MTSYKQDQTSGNLCLSHIDLEEEVISNDQL